MECKECAPNAATSDALNISEQDTAKFYPMFLTIDKAVEFTGLSKKTINELLKSYEPLPYVEFDGNSRKFIIRDEIFDYITKRFRVGKRC